MATASNGYLSHYLEILKQQRPDVDPRLFSAILMCLVAGNHNLLVRTEEADVPRVAAAATDVLQSLFGRQTRQLQLSKQEEPTTFLKCLLTRPPATPLHPRPSSFHRTSISSQTPLPSSPLSDGLTRNSGSFTATAPYPSYGIPHALHSEPLERQPSATSELKYHNNILSSSPALRAATLLPPTGSSPRLGRQSSEAAYFPTTHSPFNGTSLDDAPKSVPDAVVLTGLDSTTLAIHVAVSQVLQHQSILLSNDDDNATWQLPADFMMVHVCSLNSLEAPELPPFLLKYFAFNITIIPEPLVPSPTPFFALHSYAIIPNKDIALLHHIATTSSHISPHLDTYINNLLLAVRHHPQLQGSMLGAQCSNDLESFVHASSVLFVSLQSGMQEEINSEITVPSSNTPLPSTADLPSHISCTEKDVGRVFAGILAHRVAVQMPADGPLHSELTGAVDSPDLEDLHDTKFTGILTNQAPVIKIVLKAWML
ncbi:hypothetical protein DL93DRAFT_2152696 [Clavulina sp. PMI_390]|nr:hypothetical protein DL93DRAFT_2152696 [Clavulina sp. PMI_390]